MPHILVISLNWETLRKSCRKRHWSSSRLARRPLAAKKILPIAKKEKIGWRRDKCFASREKDHIKRVELEYRGLDFQNKYREMCRCVWGEFGSEMKCAACLPAVRPPGNLFFKFTNGQKPPDPRPNQTEPNQTQKENFWGEKIGMEYGFFWKENIMCVCVSQLGHTEARSEPDFNELFNYNQHTEHTNPTNWRLNSV